MEAADLLPKLILFADDDPDDRELLRHTISKLDPSVDIISATDGIDALSKLETLKSANRFPCLIILDINMPRMDGIKTLTEIKKDQRLKNIPVVFFTTSAKEWYVDLIEKHNIEIITKPYSMSVIEKEVTRLLSFCN